MYVCMITLILVLSTDVPNVKVNLSKVYTVYKISMLRCNNSKYHMALASCTLLANVNYLS